MKKFNFSITILLFLSIFSCKKTENVLVENTKMSRIESLTNFAQFLIDDFNSEGQLKLKQIDLYLKTHNEEFSITDLKEEGVSQRGKTSLSQLIGQNPLMQVAYPSFAFKTDESFEEHINRIQYFIVLNDDIVLDEVSTLEAFDANGNLVTISSRFDENIRYAVIKINEAFDAIRDGETTSIKGKSIPTSLSS
jgi:hypothetical protein